MPTKAGVYKITNPNNKVYIGQTWQFNIRMAAYKRGNCHQQRHLWNSIKIYGWDKHLVEMLFILENPSQDELNQLEQWYWRIHKNSGVAMLNIREPNGSKGMASEETKRLMSLSQQKCTARDVKLYRYSLNGEFMDDWRNSIKASEHFKISPSKLSDCARGRCKSAAGFVWRYFKKYRIEAVDYQIGSPTKIIQYTKQLKFIKEWKSASQAQRDLDIAKSDICRSVSGERKTAGGFIWRKAS